jgi:putative DNA primase/helicase
MIRIEDFPDPSGAKNRAEPRADPLEAFQELEALGGDASSSGEATDAALRRFAAAVAQADPIERATARENAIEKLQRLGFRGPAALVDAALAMAEPAAEEKPGPRLSDPQPWPEPVSAGDLLDELVALLERFVVLPAHAADALSLWVLHTWCLDAADTTPRLAITSPEKRCGKTTLLSLVSVMVRRPLAASNISAAAVFRSIERFGPTLLIDEADTFLKENEELRGVLNSGHSRPTAYVVRCDGEDLEARIFSTWAAVAIACIGAIPDTLADRSIEIRLRRKGPGESVARLRGKARAEVEGVVDRWRQRALRWARDHAQRLADLAHEPPEEIDDRAADNWDLLLRIATLAGGTWPARAREAALALSAARAEAEGSRGVELLRDIWTVFAEGSADRLSTADLLASLNSMEERPWSEYRKGKGMAASNLARLLRPYGIESRTVRIGAGTSKGYLRSSFEDSWTRYTPLPGATPLGEVTTSQPRESRQNRVGLNRFAVVPRAKSGRADQG